MASFRTSIRTSGPFFAHDPAKTFRHNAHDLMVAVAREGAADVRGQLAAGDAGRAPIRKLGDHVSDHVRGELRSRPAGHRYTATVFVANRGFSKPEGISLMAAASRLESSGHAFRRTFGRMKRMGASLKSELLKGIA